ncbi:ribonucleotide reductase, large subunit [Lauvirus lau218]|uniref:Ribonucleotide reductase, large subunit n=1 Tax=Lauvirus lau218 TaxID=1465639 RepID=A0A060BS23_9CAUD|nr:ribonucleotide reductase, large subunit [Lauvirus lau218]
MIIDYTRDLNLSEFAIETLKDRYLLEGETSPQEAFARAATAFSDSPAMAGFLLLLLSLLMLEEKGNHYLLAVFLIM